MQAICIGRLLVMICVGSILTACGKPDAEADFRFVSASAHHTLDPQKATWQHDIRIIDCLFEPLVRVRADNYEIELAAAESWEVREDGLLYVFRLRRGARWSNGDPVTSQDFMYAWQRALMPDSASGYTQLLFCIQGAESFFNSRQKDLMRYASSSVNQSLTEAEGLLRQAYIRFRETVGISAPDEYTFEVRLQRRTPYFLRLCSFVTFMPIHSGSAEKQATVHDTTGALGTDLSWNDPAKLICNGPYVLKECQFKERLLLTANPQYWDRGSMGNSSLLEVVIENPQTALLKYDHGEVDWLPDLPTAKSIAADLIQSGRKDIHVASAAGTYFYSFNCKPRLNDGRLNPLADKRVRLALSMGIDRQTIVEKVTRLGIAQPTALSFIPLGVFQDYNSPVESGVTFNSALAKKLLAEAGFVNGKGLEGLSILYNVEGGHEAIAQQIKRSWESNLGISVSMEGVESRHMGERLKNQDYTICRAAWFGDYLDPTTFLDKFRSDNGNNDTGWEDQEYDSLLDRAVDARNPRERMRFLAEAETILLREQPIAPIYQYINLWVFDKEKVEGLIVNPWNLRRLEHVRIKKTIHHAQNSS
jgi:oligopeptide transport system substrate-binding protein